jgi:hypothetical protein
MYTPTINGEITRVPRRQGVTPLMFAKRFSPVAIGATLPASRRNDGLWLIENGRWWIALASALGE